MVPEKIDTDPIEAQLLSFKGYMETYWDLLPKPSEGVDSHTQTLPTRFCGDRGILTRDEFFKLDEYIKERSGKYESQGWLPWDFSTNWRHWEPILRENWSAAADKPEKEG